MPNLKNQPKGLKLILGVTHSFIYDSHGFPTVHDIVEHIMTMEDWEFNQYMDMKDCQENISTIEHINHEIEKKAIEKEKERIAKTRKKNKNKVE